jgi:hypothetical protein
MRALLSSIFLRTSFRASKTLGFAPSRNLPVILREILRCSETGRFRFTQDDASLIVGAGR